MRLFTTPILMIALSSSSILGQSDIPKAADPRLVVELVASQPDIVHPVACDFDAKGRLLVVESHTHFAPQGYKGPKFDRILAFDVRKPGSKPTTLFEGTRHTMDIATHPDGSVYVATRNEILRLRETKDGVKSERIAFLDTKGDYPHNGLSGLCFDFKGDLYFGMGENLGAKYTLIGTDGEKFSGEGDGGHIFHCTADGKKLRRVATGFWNPFGICRDIYGRTFAVDNDPDQAPPCRMLHVVEGGDYGFRFCYGRSGKHPFQSWHGELPGTLPMMTGVGEAPCEILSYESDGLPKEYLGQLLVTSWADHRVERYQVKPHGASFKAERLPFVQGGKDFRPTGMCVAPDGSLYVCDWVLSNYTLHGKGAIWHIREKESRERKRPEEPKEAIFSMHRPLREAAARKLVSDQKSNDYLRVQFQHTDVRVRATATMAYRVQRIEQILSSDKPPTPDARILVPLEKLADNDADVGMRQLGIEALGLFRGDGTRFLDSKYPAILRAEAIWYLFPKDEDAEKLVRFFGDQDPFIRHLATERFARGGLASRNEFRFAKPRLALERVGELLVWRNDLAVRQEFSDPKEALVLVERMASHARRFLEDADDEVRFLAVKWVADEKLQGCRKEIEKALLDPKLSVRMYTALATALARIDGKDVNEKSLADYFAKQLADERTPAAQRAMLLKQVPVAHKAMTVELLTKLLDTDDAPLKFEAVRALAEHPSPKRHEPLLKVLRDPKLDAPLRGFAMIGLDDRAADFRQDFMNAYKDRRLHGDVDRALVERKPPLNRPKANDIDLWLKWLHGEADADAGARVFFHAKSGGCSKCHRIDGRGADVGPDLSHIGRTERRHILESILQPSSTVAPHYVAWHLETADGKVRTGMLLHTQLDEYTYLDPKGGRFNLKTGDLVEQRPLAVSIMPEGLIERMTDTELRDLLAYLQTRK